MEPTVEEVMQSAEAGDSESQFRLGLMYDRGIGIPQDYLEASKWYRKVAEQGNAWGQIFLSLMYEFGKGLPQDYMQAYLWMSLAAIQGVEDAMVESARLADHLTAAQLAQVEKMVQQWRPTLP
ncbi:MAG: sel1 repeat family protein [Magnetococcales bacterium]|nr:sel1 repeat family protein [Magnetococcales bacterium]